MKQPRAEITAGVSKAGLRWGLYFGFAGGDCFFAIEQQPGAPDDGHLDHLAVDGDGADPFGERLVIGGNDAASVVDFIAGRAEFLVEDWDLAWMDGRCADRAEAARAADRPSEALEIVKLGDRADKAADELLQPYVGETALKRLV
jgi:hypothetical protein